MEANEENPDLEMKNAADVGQAPHRMKYLLHQLDIIPKGCRKFYKNLMRANPTSPLYLFLIIGVLGTNTARYSAVRRPSGHVSNVIRTGCFYNFIGPSRFGKGMAMRVLKMIGGHIQKKRKTVFERFVECKVGAIPGNDRVKQAKTVLACKILRPNRVFLSGGNALQTHSMAAHNGGCGLISVGEIKNGKCAYTDPDGTYSTLLVFYDRDVDGKSYRNAEEIPDIDNGRIQLIAAGLREDWTTFVQKVGNLSGMLARVLPVIAYDREIIRLDYERMPHYAFPLDGVKEVMMIIENHFATFESSQATPPLTFQFSESTLNKTYRETNSLLVAVFDEDEENDSAHYMALLNNPPPTSAELKEEGSGCGLVSVFIEQTLAHFQPLIQSSADDNFLRGLKDNLLRVASDFYWADFIPEYLTTDGVLTSAKKTKLGRDLTKMITDQVVTIPETIVPYIFKFMTYVLNGVFHLNQQACPSSVPENVDENSGSRKRRIIVLRLSEGDGGDRKRRFYLSRLKRSLGDITPECLEQQLRILKVQAVVTTPTHRSVALERNLCADALEYLVTDCAYTPDDLILLNTANNSLTD